MISKSKLQFTKQVSGIYIFSEYFESMYNSLCSGIAEDAWKSSVFVDFIKCQWFREGGLIVDQ